MEPAISTVGVCPGRNAPVSGLVSNSRFLPTSTWIDARVHFPDLRTTFCLSQIAVRGGYLAHYYMVSLTKTDTASCSGGNAASFVTSRAAAQDSGGESVG